jgi:hypothetical protein
MGTSRHPKYFVGISLLVLLLITSLGLSVDYIFTQSQATEGQFPESIIVSSNVDTTPHLLELKATQQGDAGAQKVSGFNLDTINAVTAQTDSQLIVYVTDGSVKVIEAKVRMVSDRYINLVPSTSSQATNAFSLANLPEGVYTLDVIA